MAAKKAKHRKVESDMNVLAHSIVARATGQEPRDPPEPAAPQKNAAAVALGRLGGLKGGAARAAKLSPSKRTRIARKAAQVRWSMKQK